MLTGHPCVVTVLTTPARSATFCPASMVPLSIFADVEGSGVDSWNSVISCGLRPAKMDAVSAFFSFFFCFRTTID